MSVPHTKTMITKTWVSNRGKLTIWKNYPEDQLYISDDNSYYANYPELVEVENYFAQSGWTNIYELAEHICDNTFGLYKVEAVDNNRNGISIYCQ